MFRGFKPEFSATAENDYFGPVSEEFRQVRWLNAR